MNYNDIFPIKTLRWVWITAICVFLGFQLPATDAWASNQPAEKFAIKIDVTSQKYGAKKNKDSTEAIQKALNAAAKKATNKKRSLVTIPAGTFYISKTLQIDSNVYLKCDKKTIIMKITKNMLYMLRSQRRKKGKYGAVRNITVEGGTWDAKYLKFKPNTGGSLFFFVHGQNLEFKNLTLRKNFGTHLLEMGAVKDVKVTGCKMYGFQGVKKGDEKEAIQLDIPHNYDVMPMAEPYDDTPCVNVYIENNEIHNYPRAVGSHTSVQGVYPNNIIIRNNDIHDITGAAIYAYNYTNLTVTGNTIHKVGNGVILKSYASEAGQTYFKRKRGVKETKPANGNYNLLVENNKITTINKAISKNEGLFGVFVYGTNKLPVNGCEIRYNDVSSSSSGIYIKYSSNGSITDNKLYRLNNSGGGGKDFVVDAIKLQYGKNNEIKSNYIYNSNGNRFDNGIGIRNNCTNTVMADNQIESVKHTGIGVYFGSTANISGNTISNPGKRGITVFDNSSANIQENNGIHASGEYGISVSNDSGISLVGSTVTGSKSMGINLVGAAVGVISNNTISGNGRSGINISGKTTVQVMNNNQIIDNSYKGIGITDASVIEMRDNVLSNPQAEWEVTVASSNAAVESMRVLTIDKVSENDVLIKGSVQGADTISAWIHGMEYKGTIEKKEYAVRVPQLLRGMDIKVTAADKLGNTIYANAKL